MLDAFSPLAATADGLMGSLRDAITEANNNADAENTFTLEGGTYNLTVVNTMGQENDNDEGDLDLLNEYGGGAKTYIFEGAGAGVTFIDASGLVDEYGGGGDRVFHVIGSDVTVIFRNLTITGGNAFDDGTAGDGPNDGFALGGGIYNSGGTVTLEDSVVEFNRAQGGQFNGAEGLAAWGGGIYSNSQTGLTIRDSEVRNNVAQGGNAGSSGFSSYGGAGEGGGVYQNFGLLTVDNSVFSGNQAIGGNGDANSLGNGGSGGQGAGGGLNMPSSSANFLNNVSFRSNTAQGGDGGLGAFGSSDTPDGHNGGFGGEAEGGGFWARNASLDFDGAVMVFNLNRAEGGDGGEGGFGVVGDSGDAGNGGFGGQGGIARGGGFYYSFDDEEGNAPDMTMVGAQFTGNIALGGDGAEGGDGATDDDFGGTGDGGIGGTGGDGTGGGLFFASGGEGGEPSLTLIDSTVDSNQAIGGDGGEGGDGGDVTFTIGLQDGGSGGGGGPAQGGGIFQGSGELNIISSTISRNLAQGGDGAEGGDGGDVFSSTDFAPIQEGLNGGFGGNAQGGGLWLGFGETNVTNSTVSFNNIIGGNGGAGGAGGATFTFGQTTGAGGPGGFGAGSQGGGIYVLRSDVQLSNTTIARNQAIGGNGGPGGFGPGGNGEEGADGVGEGGGLYINEDAGTISNLISTIVADNGGSFPDVFGRIVANFSLIENAVGSTFEPGSGNNITGLDPILGPLQNNGGPTETHELLPGSPAIDNGDNPLNLDFDQRGPGFLRVINFVADIGAFETQNAIVVGQGIIVVGPADYPGGADPVVRVFDMDGKPLATFLAYDPGFEGGVRVAVGDVNGDGVPDVITGAGPTGAPNVQVFLGSFRPNGQMNFKLEHSFFAFDPDFDGGVYVAAADINGDGLDDVIVGAGEGAEFFITDASAPQIKVVDAAKLRKKLPNGMIRNKALLANFVAFNSANETGVRVGAADVNFDGTPDIIAGEGPGGANRVYVYDGTNTKKTLLKKNAGGGDGGAYVAGGDVNGDGFADVIAGQGGRGTEIRVFSGANGKRLAKFEPFIAVEPYNDRTGVRVGAADVTGDGIADILAGTGRGFETTYNTAGNTVRAFDIADGSLDEVLDFNPYPPGHGTGVFVAGNGGDAGGGAEALVQAGAKKDRRTDRRADAPVSNSQGDELALAAEANAARDRGAKHRKATEQALSQDDFWLGQF